MEESILRWIENIPEDTIEEYIRKLSDYKKIIDKTPNKFLSYHLEGQLKKEHYEIAQYIKDTAKKRGFLLLV